MILFTQQRAQDKLHAGFAIAAGDADFDQIRPFLQPALSITEIHFADQLFDGPGKEPGKSCPNRQKQWDNP